MTIGTAANTLLSTAAVVHVVQPLFEAPATMYLVIFPPLGAVNSVTASIAFTAAFVIGNLSKMLGSSGLSINVFLIFLFIDSILYFHLINMIKIYHVQA